MRSASIRTCSKEISQNRKSEVLDVLARHMEANGSTERPVGFKDIASQYNDARINSQDSRNVALEVSNRRKEIQFKASHILLIGFFSWMLYVKMPGRSIPR